MQTDLSRALPYRAKSYQAVEKCHNSKSKNLFVLLANAGLPFVIVI